MPRPLQNPAGRASRERIRRMLAARSQQPAQPPVHPFVDLALVAGRDALQSAGPGWFPNSDVEASVHGGQPVLLDFSSFRRIEIRVNPALLTQRAAALQLVLSTDPLNIVLTGVRSLVRLYSAFYDECPRDLWRHHRLVDAANWGAFRTYAPAPTELRIAAAITSFLEKSIVAYHLTRAEGSDFVSGLAMERTLNQHPPHFLWALFQRCQSLLFPAQWEQANAFTISPRQPDPAADALLADVVAILFRARLRSVNGRPRLRGTIRCPAPWEWTETAEDLAELLAPYLEQEADPGMAPIPFPAPGPHSTSLPGRSVADPGDAANPFLNSGNPPPNGSSSPHAGTGSAPGRLPGRGIGCTVEQIDDYYSRQAQSLQVKDTGNERQKEKPEMLPIGFLDHAPATLRDLACGHIDWFATRRTTPSEANPTGLQLRRLAEPLEIPADAFEPASRQVPNLLLVCDSSGSMSFNPQATGAARGKYDVVLMACWGLFRFLTERGLEDCVWINAINFSGTTRTSGWHRGNVLPVKRVLAAYEGGGTTLSRTALRTARESAPGRFVTVLVTDGSLSNTGAALEELRSFAETGNNLVLLHIGAPNAFTQGIGRLGGTVHLLNQAQELVRLCLDLATTHYGDSGNSPPHPIPS